MRIRMREELWILGFKSSIHPKTEKKKVKCPLSWGWANVLEIFRWSLGSYKLTHVTFDPPDIRANTSIYGKGVSGTSTARYPWSCTANKPATTLKAWQGAATIAVADTASLSSNAYHGAFIHWATIFTSAGIVTGYRSLSLFKTRSKCICVWIYPTPTWIETVNIQEMELHLIPFLLNG